MSITDPTLRKNYFRQLKIKDDARARVEAKCLGKLKSLVEAGAIRSDGYGGGRLRSAGLVYQQYRK
ncbi:hypothetical protein [Pseudovibrio sp. Tun.PSC04-5.I4]|uniref:hypothetical protein n=1 Tax=Pseudovibrio sp. Tun.PSC04-5.I4 TaxID=1798213 RepID=UPI000AA55A4F|nr:hypothetical protein [Pseudovibrio sp. Tun.PSC04-5.I4]